MFFGYTEKCFVTRQAYIVSPISSLVVVEEFIHDLTRRDLILIFRFPFVSAPTIVVFEDSVLTSVVFQLLEASDSLACIMLITHP